MHILVPWKDHHRRCSQTLQQDPKVCLSTIYHAHLTSRTLRKQRDPIVLLKDATSCRVPRRKPQRHLQVKGSMNYTCWQGKRIHCYIANATKRPKAEGIKKHGVSTEILQRWPLGNPQYPAILEKTKQNSQTRAIKSQRPIIP